MTLARYVLIGRTSDQPVRSVVKMFRKSLLVLALLSLGASACDLGDKPDSGDAPLSDLDALLDGAPTNDELPFEIKADGPVPRVHDDLLELQSPVKSQGRRGVCSIFSTVGLMEHLYLAAGMENPDFSEQYMQWSAKFEVGSFPNSSGSNAYYNLRAASQFGIPAEEAWPYEINQWDEEDDAECDGEDDQPTRCYTNGQPPAEALEAEKFHLPPGRWLNSTRASIMDHIRVNGTGVVVGMEFFYQAWNHRLTELHRDLGSWDQGIVRMPNDEDVEVSREAPAGHSILIVGWDLDKEFPRVDGEGNTILDADGNPVMETGFYLFKNSWGTEGFGIDHPAGAGYGWLSMEYVDRYGRARVSDIPDFTPPVDPIDPDDPVEPGNDTFTSEERVEIPDNDDTGVSSVLEVPAGDAVGAVSVSVSIEHTWRGDLTVRLRHGDVVEVLHQRTGGGQDDLELELVTEAFDGMDREGEWVLEVVDSARLDSGNLNRWSITL